MISQDRTPADWVIRKLERLGELDETPGSIRVEPKLNGLLDRLARRLNGRLAIVSGRSVADLSRHLECSALYVSGSHGVELRPPGGILSAVEPPSSLGTIQAAVHDFARGTEGLLVEEKPVGVALHFRKAPHSAQQVEEFMAALGEAHDMAVQRGAMVVELRPKGADKGDALRHIMAEPGFAGARPVFVGDDLTDEHGFQAAAEMAGAGVLVGPARATAAQFRLADVAAVADWLDQAA